MLKKIIPVLLTLLFAISITGCRDKNANAMIAFDETDLGNAAGQDMLYYARVNTKDQLVLLVMNDCREVSFITLDKSGKEVHRFNCGLIADEAYFTLDKQDHLFLLMHNYIMDDTRKNVKEITRQVVQYDAMDVEVKSTELGAFTPGNDYSGLAGFEVDSAGNMFLLKRMGYIEVFDENGRMRENIGSQNYSCMTMDIDECLVLGRSGDNGKDCGIEKIKPSKGQNVWEKNLNRNDTPRFVITDETSQSIYVLTNRGVKKYSSSGNDNGYVLDIMGTSLSGYDSHITGMDMDSDGCFYFTVSKDNKTNEEGNVYTSLYMYTPTEEGNEAKNVQITLKLAYTGKEYFLENAISEFHKAYPDIKIERNEYSTGVTEEDFSNFVMTLNTELMSNNGPDIISTRSLPNYVYISRGYYANLSNIMAEDNEFNISQYKANLLNSFKYKGNMYVMPIGISCEAIAANQTILDEENIVIDDENWTWNDYLEICKKVTKDIDGYDVPERYAIPFIGPSMLLGDIFRYNFDQFIDMENKEATFDSPEFISALKLVKEFWDSGVICPNIETYGSKTEVYDLYDRNGIVFVPETVFSYSAMGIYSENTVFLKLPSLGGVPRPNYHSELFAINEKSKHKEEAWEFIKYLISEDIQKQRTLSGFAVNKAADVFRRDEDRIISRTGQMRMGSKDRRVVPLTDTMLNTADKLITDTGFLPLLDQKINLIIVREATPFFNNEKSAEEVAKSIQYKVDTYLNE